MLTTTAPSLRLPASWIRLGLAASMAAASTLLGPLGGLAHASTPTAPITPQQQQVQMQILHDVQLIQQLQTQTQALVNVADYYNPRSCGTAA
jgi:hypothetical protein